ncbi:lantibiotic immunity ABC transporter MutG family permease subunit [Bacillus xiapuensis]|uniref:lantibiotic immunity ABC transporter MutG family permease subunit n=1 Tax=Bacillus xiapuensis TaxID=2014075 RepID=UPI000C24CEA3|nr:lantibiotic immunity ABC transporter MutG family permease subunit [Bacillus xiapuensis]
MLQLIKLIKADILKLKSTQMIWMHLYIPLLGLIIFLGYYSFSPWSDFNKISAYLQILCIVFPILIGIITSMVADQEYTAGGFQNILTSSEPKCLTFTSKLILFLLLGTLSTILAVIGFYIGYSFVGNNIYSIFINLVIVGILIGSNVFQYILHFFLSFRFSKGVSIGVGIAESFASALFLTGMGDGRWPFVPSSWSIRFVESLLVKYQNGSSVFIDPDLHLGVIISIVVTVLSIVIMLVWFTRWEGNKLEE